jgi:hypothetical protein
MQIAVAKTEYNFVFVFVFLRVKFFNCSFIVKLNAMHILLVFLNVKMFASKIHFFKKFYNALILNSDQTLE